MSRCDARIWLLLGGLLVTCGCEFRVTNTTAATGKPEVHLVFATATSSPQPPSADLGLDGYCPVTLVHASQWKKGDDQIAASHFGVTYFFASEAERQYFLVEPSRYCVVAKGFDIVAETDGSRKIRGNRRHGVFFQDRIFLFESEASLEKFWKQPHTYAAPYLKRETAGVNATVKPSSVANSSPQPADAAITQNLED